MLDAQDGVMIAYRMSHSILYTLVLHQLMVVNELEDKNRSDAVSFDSVIYHSGRATVRLNISY